MGSDCSGEGFLAEYFLTAVIVAICVLLLFIGFKDKFKMDYAKNVLWFIIPILVVSLIGIIAIMIIKRRT